VGLAADEGSGEGGQVWEEGEELEVDPTCLKEKHDIKISLFTSMEEGEIAGEEGDCETLFFLATGSPTSLLSLKGMDCSKMKEK